MKRVLIITGLVLLLVSLSSTWHVESFKLLGPRWETPTTTFYVDIGGQPGPWNWNAAFETAMVRWNNSTKFTYLTNRRSEGPCDRGDGQNGVGFSSTVCGDAFGETSLAVAAPITKTNGSIFTEVNITFNDKYNWQVYDGPLVEGIPDFRRTAVHELGHALGLGHENDLPSIMHYQIGNLVRPTSDDIAGVDAIYSEYPNLYPHRPSGWSDKLVVSRNVGSNTDSSNLTTNDTLYLDLAVLNNGSTPTASRFEIRIYVDDVSTKRLYYNPPLKPNFYTYREDVNLGKLGAGTHSIRIHADARNEIAESNELDNEYTKTISVTQARESPTLEAISPQVGVPGSTFQVMITGTSFANANSVEFSGDGIEAIISPVGVTDDSLPVTVTIDPSAQAGWRTVTVTNSYGNSERFDGFVVQSKGEDQKFTVDLKAGYYTAEVRLLATTTSITTPKGQVIVAEVADTPEQRGRGLVGRASLATPAGMIYIFPNNERNARFVTQGMKFPLDIIWMDNERIVNFISRDTPTCPATEAQCPNYGGGTPTRYVLEINAGQAAALGISEGVQLSFDIPPQLGGKKAGYWGMEVLTADRVLSGGFNLGGGYDSERGPGFGAFLIEQDQTVMTTANAQPLEGQPPSLMAMTLLDTDKNTVAGPLGPAASLEMSNRLSTGFYTLELSSSSGKGTFQLALSADHFSAGVVVGGYIDVGIVGFGGFNLPRPTQATIRLYNSAYSTGASGRVQLRLVDSAGQPVSVTLIK